MAGGGRGRGGVRFQPCFYMSTTFGHESPLAFLWPQAQRSKKGLETLLFDGGNGIVAAGGADLLAKAVPAKTKTKRMRMQNQQVNGAHPAPLLLFLVPPPFLYCVRCNRFCNYVCVCDFCPPVGTMSILLV